MIGRASTIRAIAMMMLAATTKVLAATPFSSPTNTSLQDMSLWNELWLAYNERAFAVGYPSNNLFTTNSSIQRWQVTIGQSAPNFGLADMQTNLIQLCVRYANTNEFLPTGTNLYTRAEGATFVNPFVVTSFYQHAGITNGFRRATEWPSDWHDYSDPAYSYGVAQQYDIVGPWLVVDIQRALTILDCTVYQMPYDYDIGSGTHSTSLCFAAQVRLAVGCTNVTDINNAWESNSWVDVTGKQIGQTYQYYGTAVGAGYYSVQRYYSSSVSGEYRQKRMKTIPWIHKQNMTWQPISDCRLGLDADLWMFAGATDANTLPLPLDKEGVLGWHTNLVWGIIGSTTGIVTDVDHIAIYPDYLGSSTERPVDCDVGPFGNWTDGETGFPSNPYTEATWFNDACWIVRWRFTHKGASE